MPSSTERVQMPDDVGGENGDAPHDELRNGSVPKERNKPEQVPGIDDRGTYE